MVQEYGFGSHTIKIFFCGTCGANVYNRSVNPKFIYGKCAINVSPTLLLRDIDRMFPYRLYLPDFLVPSTCIHKLTVFTTRYAYYRVLIWKPSTSLSVMVRAFLCHPWKRSFRSFEKFLRRAGLNGTSAWFIQGMFLLFGSTHSSHGHLTPSDIPRLRESILSTSRIEISRGKDDLTV